MPTIHCLVIMPLEFNMHPKLVGTSIGVRIMPISLSFSISFQFISTIPCPKHDVKLHNYALTITTTTHGMCLWSRHPVLDIICELEDFLQGPLLPADDHRRFRLPTTWDVYS